MTKGLSKLQKKILQIAHKNQGNILARDVLAEVYGFPANIQGKKMGGMVFSRRAIGERRYQSASVSVARAFNRLAKRGLAHRQYSGVTLTEAGVRIAESLI